MDFIKSLTESKLFSSKTAFKRHTGRELAELCYFHIIALRIMSCEKITSMLHAKPYSLKTQNHDDFKKWKQSATDLYYLLYALKGHDVQQHDTTSEHFIGTLALDMPKINAWLLSISSHNDMSETRAHRLFATLDNQFKVSNQSYRSIRRLAMNWPELSLRERQLCFTRLIQIFRKHCSSSDLFQQLERLARNNGLELQNAVDAESDDGKDTSLSRAAAHLSSIQEDDGGAAPAAAAPSIATTSADIAPLVKPLGMKVRRRNPK